MRLTLEVLRRYAVARSLFKPTSLGRALRRFGFLQADPIRAPARAQDLTLRHRVLDYRAGDLERRYTRLGVEEDFFVNYGFVTRAHHALMHPRPPRHKWTPVNMRQARTVLEFIRERRIVHPREVDAHFAHGKVTNWFGGSSNASTQLLDAMHYRGLLRVARREGGTRLYALPRPRIDVLDLSPEARLDQLVDLIVGKYAPLPAATFGQLVHRLRHAAPQWERRRRAAWSRAKARLPHATVDGVEWYWPAGENPASRRHQPDARVRFLTPFDPIVWDRRRFEIFWRWAYRFEAYTPAPKRKLGYYALPLLWHDQVIGWANVTAGGGGPRTRLGYVAGHAPRDPAYGLALERELTDLALFLCER